MIVVQTVTANGPRPYTMSNRPPPLDNLEKPEGGLHVPLPRSTC
jgi:hypothetical protein